MSTFTFCQQPEGIITGHCMKSFIMEDRVITHDNKTKSVHGAATQIHVFVKYILIKLVIYFENFRLTMTLTFITLTLTYL